MRASTIEKKLAQKTREYSLFSVACRPAKKIAPSLPQRTRALALRSSIPGRCWSSILTFPRRPFQGTRENSLLFEASRCWSHLRNHLASTFKSFLEHSGRIHLKILSYLTSVLPLQHQNGIQGFPERKVSNSAAVNFMWRKHTRSTEAFFTEVAYITWSLATRDSVSCCLSGSEVSWVISEGWCLV